MRAKALCASSFLFVLLSHSFVKGDGNEVEGGVAGYAALEVQKRQHQVKSAQTLFTAGSHAFADKSYGEAMDNYKAAFVTLPPVPAVEEQRRVFFKRYQLATLRFAELKVAEARWQEAIDTLTDVMNTAKVNEVPLTMVDPQIRKMLGELKSRDDRYNMANSPRHLRDMEEVQAKLVLGKGYLELGDYDRAERSYHAALEIDPYNNAARRGLENVERHRLDYFDQARQHARSKMLREVAAGWESPVEKIDTGTATIDLPDEVTSAGSPAIEEKLSRIIIPRIEFNNARLVDVLGFLSQKSQELDTFESDPARRGVNIVIDSSGSLQGRDMSQSLLTVRLASIPLADALKYVTQQVDMKYRVENFAVKVIPESVNPDAGLIARSFNVPPGFISSTPGGGGAAANDDPFANDDALTPNTTIQVKRISAREFLEQNGINFPDGATAKFIASTSTLVVRNTAEELINVENLVRSSIEGGSKMVQIGIKMISVEDRLLRQAGLDFLLGAANIGNTPRAFFSGGTNGNSNTPVLPQDYGFNNPQTGLPVGLNPVTAGLRMGDLASTQTIDDILNRENPGAGSARAPGIFSLAGVFTDPQFQMMVRLLSQQKGADVMQSSSVLVKPGQIAKIEQVREFIYPTEYDPPEIPNELGFIPTGGNTRLIVDVTEFPAVPATPTAFEMRRLGNVFEVEPTVSGDNKTINLNVLADFSEFAGFINYGVPIRNAVLRLNDGSPSTVTENRILMPVFDSIKETTNVTIWDGNTIAIGGYISETMTSAEDKIPYAGDLPVIGKAFRSKVKDATKRALIIFVSAELVDPGGSPINAPPMDEEPELFTRQDVPVRNTQPVGPPPGMVYPAK